MKTRNIIFASLAALLPVLFLVILEIILSVFDLYPQTPLFYNKSKYGQQVVEINSRIGERYFNEKKIPVPNLYPQTFTANKSDNTFRIFCLGGSTTAGFPYEMTVPFPQQLKFQLQQNHPDLQFEVINMGLSAINSFTVLDWIPDIVKYSPDLIIIYMGHNEFYGAYGTGSTISFGHQAWMVRTIMALQKFRVVQMVNNLANKLVPTPTLEPGSTIMEKIIDDKFIAANSDLRQITHANFSANLDLILAGFSDAGTPVILSSLVSNLKDQSPLGVIERQTSDSTRAAFYYQQGLIEYGSGDSTSAFSSFTAARDRDEIPFRANSIANSIIKSKCDQNQIYFVDMNDIFNSNSPMGIPGNNLFCDHLHPNPVGYSLMADQFYRAIVKTNLLPAVDGAISDPTVPFLVTDLDWEIGSLRIFKLKHHWPFANERVDYSNYPPYLNEASARFAKDYLFKHNVWGKAHQEMAEFYLTAGDVASACKEYQGIVEMYPQKIEYYFKLIDCATSLNAWNLVEITSRRGLEKSKTKGMLFYYLAKAQRMTGQMEAALTNIQNSMNSPELTQIQSANITFTYARFLLEMGQTDLSINVLDSILDQVPDFAPARKLLEDLPES